MPGGLQRDLSGYFEQWTSINSLPIGVSTG